jgi:hypothetical protein
MEAVPLEQINLPVTFDDEINFRTETLTFEVVGFPKTYHMILGRPAYAKFMAVVGVLDRQPTTGSTRSR